ncbi:hypothetical protein BDZ97DRAFT_1851574 [Flammula alnicola]|nr:hypothetical protein BDZ97DRAFT_1851574 [Flammula alnicola]
MRPPPSSGVRSPLRLSPVGSSAALGSSMGALQQQQQAPSGGGSPSGSSATLNNSSANSGSTPTSGQDDAVYQAFVRQWCFAQAPGPTVGSSVGAGAPGVPGGGIEARGKGEGPRLVVN